MVLSGQQLCVHQPIAKISLLLPKYAYSLISESAPREYETIAELMYIPFDGVKQYHPEFDGFTWSKC